MGEIEQKVKEYILREFLPGESPDDLDETTPLVTGGILDSIATLKLVVFLQQEFGVQLEAHETDTEHLDNVASIASLVRSKQS